MKDLSIELYKWPNSRLKRTCIEFNNFITWNLWTLQLRVRSSPVVTMTMVLFSSWSRKEDLDLLVDLVVELSATIKTTTSSSSLNILSPEYDLCQNLKLTILINMFQISENFQHRQFTRKYVMGSVIFIKQNSFLNKLKIFKLGKTAREHTKRFDYRSII